MQAHLALEAAAAELESWRERGDMARRLDELAGHREPVAAAANAALQGGLSGRGARARRRRGRAVGGGAARPRGRRALGHAHANRLTRARPGQPNAASGLGWRGS